VDGADPGSGGALMHADVAFLEVSGSFDQ
jgi:hypothetical protein